MPIYNPSASGTAEVAAGTYTGDNTANRQIPHGLSGTPKAVLIYNSTMWFWLHADASGTYINYMNSIGQGQHAVTTPLDGTYFMVGNSSNYGQSANSNGAEYNWIAVR